MEPTEVTSMYESHKDYIDSKSTDKAYLDMNVNKQTNTQTNKYVEINILQKKAYVKKEQCTILLNLSILRKERSLNLSSYDFFCKLTTVW